MRTRFGSRLCLRRYEQKDHDAVCVLHRAALGCAGADDGHGPSDDDLHQIEAVYVRAGGEFLVGEVGGAIVAMGPLRRTGPERGEIRRMRVAPTHQPQGFGRHSKTNAANERLAQHLWAHRGDLFTFLRQPGWTPPTGVRS